MASLSSSAARASSHHIVRIAGIDASSWLSWACYGMGFCVALKLAPEAAADVVNGGIGLAVLAGAVATFFASILIIQHQMRVSLRNSAFGAPRKLTTSGLFGLSRNPMYVAFLIPILSIAVMSPLAAIAAAVLYIAAMNTLVISNEEDSLRSMFGADYRRYCANTPRWLFW